MRIGDLISFKPKSFGEDDWSNPCIVLNAFISDKSHVGGHRDTIWVVWCDGGKHMVNLRHDDIMYLTTSLQNKG